MGVLMSNKKNDVEVIINNKIYTICGFESDEYILKIASYINSKFAEIKECEGYNNLNNEMKSIMIEINIADDYFKAKKLSEEYLSESDEKTKEIFEMKHELIAYQSKYELLNGKYENLKEEFANEQKKLVRLETELEECKRQLENYRKQNKNNYNKNEQNKSNDK